MFYGSDIKQSFMHEAYTLLNELSNISGLMKERNDTRAEDIIKESLTLTEKEKGQRASNLIRQNLLRLNVYMEDLSVVEYRQLPAYGLADLFADIGGTLGLWMGISVLTIMELVELIIRLFFLLFNSETKPPNFQDEEQEYVASNGMLANHLHSGHGPGHHTGQGHDMNEKEFVDASGFDFKMHTETMA